MPDNTQNQTTTQTEFTIQQVAQRLGVSTSTVRNWLYSGKLKAIRYGSRIVRIRQSDLDAFATDYIEKH